MVERVNLGDEASRRSDTGDINLIAAANYRVDPGKLSVQNERDKRNHSYKMWLSLVLASIILTSAIVVIFSGLACEGGAEVCGERDARFIWSEKHVDMAWDILKMSLTGLLGFLLAAKESTSE